MSAVGLRENHFGYAGLRRPCLFRFWYSDSFLSASAFGTRTSFRVNALKASNGVRGGGEDGCSLITAFHVDPAGRPVVQEGGN